MLRSLGYNVFDIDNEFGSRPESLTPASHLAIGKPVEIRSPYSDHYSAAGDASINDGLRGDWSYSDGRWLGFLCDLNVVVDLETVHPVHYVGAAFISQKNNHVALPERVEVYVSEDGKDYELAGTTYSELPADTAEMNYVTLGCVLNVSARYICFKAYRRDLPQHEWLFTDEIVVN